MQYLCFWGTLRVEIEYTEWDSDDFNLGVLLESTPGSLTPNIPIGIVLFDPVLVAAFTCYGVLVSSFGSFLCQLD